MHENNNTTVKREKKMYYFKVLMLYVKHNVSCQWPIVSYRCIPQTVKQSLNIKTKLNEIVIPNNPTKKIKWNKKQLIQKETKKKKKGDKQQMEQTESE